jgi:hypothetical protein
MSLYTTSRPVFTKDWYESHFSLSSRPEEDDEEDDDEIQATDFIQAPALKRFRARMIREYLERLSSRKQEAF